MVTSTSKTWLKGCGIGCGIVALLLVVAMIGGSVVVMRPFREAVQKRETLDERYGQQADFVPAATGVISSDRLEVFVTTRTVLMEVCSEFGNIDHQIEQLDEIDDDAPAGEILGVFFNVTKTFVGMGPLMGEFFDARNRALLEVGMGLGEYTYIYTMAYMEHLRFRTTDDREEPEPSNHPNKRVRLALVEMLRNQLTSGEVQGAPAEFDGFEEFRHSLGKEIRKLERDSERLPWQDGLPPAIAASLDPYRTKLNELFCEHTVQLEFTRNRQRGIGIQGD